MPPRGRGSQHPRLRQVQGASREARQGRNPATGETIQIAASKKLTFTPAKQVKDAMNPEAEGPAGAGQGPRQEVGGALRRRRHRPGGGSLYSKTSAARLCAHPLGGLPSMKPCCRCCFPRSLLAAAPARAEGQGPVTVGLLVTLSGPGAVLGQHARDGFELYLKQHHGRLGGRDVNLVVVDDELKPDVAAARARRLIEQDKASFVVGPIFSNVLAAIFRPVTTDAILISPNAGASTFAGKACSPYFFVTSYENNQVHEVSGEYAQRKGYKRAFLIAPNYQAGKDAIAGFKSKFKGEILDEDYVPLTQLDFQADLARIAAAKPDVIYAFMPGGLGVNLVKQFRQSGLADSIPFLSAFTVDESTLPAQRDAAVGMYGGMTWAPNSGQRRPTRRSSRRSRRQYHYVPASYAMQGYDAAQVIDAAMTKSGRRHARRDKLAAALQGGRDRVAARPVPVQHQWLSDPGFLPGPGRQAAGRAVRDRNPRPRVPDYADQFARDCPLK